jgi:hypothetical protein
MLPAALLLPKHLQVVEEERKPSGGQAAVVPVQVSGVSQTPFAALHQAKHHTDKAPHT